MPVTANWAYVNDHSTENSNVFIVLEEWFVWLLMVILFNSVKLQLHARAKFNLFLFGTDYKMVEHLDLERFLF